MNSWCLSLLVGKVRLCLALYHGQCTESRPPCDDTVRLKGLAIQLHEVKNRSATLRLRLRVREAP